MRFLVDAQLPPALAVWLGEKGFAASPVHHAALGASTSARAEMSASAGSECRSIMVESDSRAPVAERMRFRAVNKKRGRCRQMAGCISSGLTTTQGRVFLVSRLPPDRDGPSKRRSV